MNTLSENSKRNENFHDKCFLTFDGMATVKEPERYGEEEKVK